MNQPADGGGPGKSLPPLVDKLLRRSENVIYCLISAVLVGGAIVLGDTGYTLVSGLHDGPTDAVRDTLDNLLLVFILVELLSAVRETMAERKIVAEPFLLVGIIASIKEVVVLAIGAKEDLDKDVEAFESAMLGIGTMTALLLVLGVATLLVRRKEREPSE